MVKGITRQVVVVKGPDPKLFEQAIFLVRESVLSEGGITEEALLQEARLACKGVKQPLTWVQRLLWSAAGAAAVSLVWAIAALL